MENLLNPGRGKVRSSLKIRNSSFHLLLGLLVKAPLNRVFKLRFWVKNRHRVEGWLVDLGQVEPRLRAGLAWSDFWLVFDLHY